MTFAEPSIAALFFGALFEKLRLYQSAESLRKANWRRNNPEKQRACKKAWMAAHPETVRTMQKRVNDRRLAEKRQWENGRYRDDPQFNLSKKIRSRIRKAFSRALIGERKPDTTIRLLGCSFSQLKDHIVSHFKPGMTWQAVVDGRIHLDHVRPVVAFDLSDGAQVAECFNYRNLQPLWAVHNLRKHAKLA